MRDGAEAVYGLGLTSILFAVGGRRAVGRATRRAMEGAPRADRSADLAGETVWRVYGIVGRALHVWPRPVRCLQSALVLQALLRRRGIDARLRLGARWDAGNLEAHAWVVVGENVLDYGTAISRFTPLDPDRAVEKSVTA